MPRTAKLIAKLPDAIPKPASLADGWFAQQGWQPFEFQREVWAHMAAGRSGVLHASTGSGKTYAVWFGAIMRTLSPANNSQIKNALVIDQHAFVTTKTIVIKKTAPPLGIVWLTPMRALAADTALALSAPLNALGLNWSVGQRTGDTPAAERSRQDKRLPTALVTTPESLTLLLTRASAPEDFKHLKVVIVDEWHELLGSKRGVQTQLALARLKMWHPELVVWGLSATLGNLNDACAALTGHTPGSAPHSPVLVRGKAIKQLTIDTLLPLEVGRFAWAGHLGLQMLQPVIAEIEQSASTLVFTNTRSQAELWYQQLLDARPDWAGVIALHHGSLDKEVRAWVEAGLKTGALKAVVATSSLDLGVDFAPVERVLQIGSAKGVARLLQRAGRSGHSPGRASRITLVPTNSLELIEAAAVRHAALAGKVESREAPSKPLDVLVQHLASMALSTGFIADEMYAEVCSAWSYRSLTRSEFDWALAFIERGGECLQAYAEYQRVTPDANGVWRVASAQIARRHRMAIGTITSDASMRIKYQSGANVGTVEESFIARLRKGDCFLFGGRLLEYLRTQDMTAYVKKATKNKGAVPRWGGGNMPLSTELADAMLATFGRIEQGDAAELELQAVRQLIATQQAWSALPTPSTLLIELWQSREGQHVFIYPFAGRNVHLGLASLIAYRLAKDAPNTFSISVNDYGFELQSAAPIDVSAITSLAVFSEANLLPDVLASLNASELAQRRFRGIARVAGLVFNGYPGAPKSSKQLQASSSLFYEVFRTYDPSNRLLAQAQTEVLSAELELGRLTDTLRALEQRRVVVKELPRPSPLCFGLLVARLREKLSTEKLSDRVQRLLKELELAAYS